MWLLSTGNYTLQAFEGGNIPSYAILSHRWEANETTFRSVQVGRCIHGIGFNKIKRCCQQALSDGHEWIWADTCCIDKRSSAELSEAINSMYEWYRRAEVCYAYLSDVEMTTSTKSAFSRSAWFSRGWTLQELLASSTVVFYDRSWNLIGTKLELKSHIQQRTGIPRQALEQFTPSDYCVSVKMSWAAQRSTTRVEDRAYSLLGLFDINMPLLYGEGSKAFLRLQEEIMKTSNDASIFAWAALGLHNSGVLADSPACFGAGRETNQDFHAAHQIFNYKKAGLKGNFWICHCAFNIHFVILGCFGQGSDDNIEQLVRGDWVGERFVVGMYLRFIEAGIYCRTTYNGQLRGFHSIRPETATSFKQRKIVITRDKAEQTRYFDVDLGKVVYPDQLVLRPAIFSARDISIISGTDDQLNIDATEAIQIWPGQKFPCGCICMQYQQSESPSLVFHFGFDLDLVPVVLLSFPTAQSVLNEGNESLECETGHVSMKFGRSKDKPKQDESGSAHGTIKSVFASQRNVPKKAGSRMVTIGQIVTIYFTPVLAMRHNYNVTLSFLQESFRGRDEFPLAWLDAPETQMNC